MTRAAKSAALGRNTIGEDERSRTVSCQLLEAKQDEEGRATINFANGDVGRIDRRQSVASKVGILALYFDTGYRRLEDSRRRGRGPSPSLPWQNVATNATVS